MSFLRQKGAYEKMVNKAKYGHEAGLVGKAIEDNAGRSSSGSSSHTYEEETRAEAKARKAEEKLFWDNWTVGPFLAVINWNIAYLLFGYPLFGRGGIWGWVDFVYMLVWMWLAGWFFTHCFIHLNKLGLAIYWGIGIGAAYLPLWLFEGF